MSASREQGTWPCPKTQQHTATTTLFQNCPPRRQARPAPLVARPIWLMATGQVSEIREATSERTTAVTTMSAPSGTALAKGSPETGWGQHSRLSARTSNGGLVGEPLRFFRARCFRVAFCRGYWALGAVDSVRFAWKWAARRTDRESLLYYWASGLISCPAAVCNLWASRSSRPTQEDQAAFFRPFFVGI